MIEIELKLAVPPAARAAVRAAVATATAQRVRLRAAYADTPDQRLAAAQFALRLRQEGRRWVQTLKGRGDGLMARLEHEVPVKAGARIDPARHAGTPAGDALARLLADGAPLEERYRTDITRTLRRTRSGGARVELAFDEGVITAGPRQLPVCEIEFELLSGPPAALAALAARWAARFGLVWDVQTKSERGHRLALGALAPPPAPAPRLRPGAGFGARVSGALARLLTAPEARRAPAAAALARVLRDHADASADPAASRALALRLGEQPLSSVLWLHALSLVLRSDRSS